MQADVLLASLQARFVGNKSGRITLSRDEVSEWPIGLLDKLLGENLLTPVEPAHVLECRGCEQACVMPVNILAAEGSRPARAFIACDKRDDVGRVRVEFSRLHQWQLTQADFERLQRTWIVSPSVTSNPGFRKSKAPVGFRSALESLLTEIEHRATRQGLVFDRYAMPGRKVDLQVLADKFDSVLEHTPRTFDDYLDGLCAFMRGARETDFYSNLFPEYFK